MKKVMSILCVVALIFAFAGCSAQEKPETVVAAYCDAVVSFDTQAKNACLQTPPETDGESLTEYIEKNKDGLGDVITFFKDNAATIRYSIIGSDVTDDTATVTVKYTYNDGTNLGQQILSDYIGVAFAITSSDISEKEKDKKTTDLFAKMFVDKAEDAELETCDAVVEFNCVKTEDGWKIVEEPEGIADIQTCNISRVFAQFSK